MNNREEKHIIDAIATYICSKAKRCNLFTREVNTDEIREMLNASFTETEKAHTRAKEILRDFT